MSATTAGCRLTMRGVARAEWTKLWSLRSFRIPLLCTIGGTAALGALISGAYRPGAEGQVDPVSIGLFGMSLATAVIAGLGIMPVTGEYSTGTIRSSMTAVPRRWPVLWCKAAVFGAVALGAFAVTVPAIFALSQSMLSGTDIRASLSDPGMVRTLVGLVASVEPLTELHPAAGAPPLLSYAVMVGWVLFGLLAASALLSRRDV
ncbi:hypothetical protein [Actinoallomurus sp. CA-142502]|uniref:hypothetical protein n=1 Tax=Actinoallomurus sp. CA-142502 TaxID=3239885 RepID=UPI003D93C0F7